MHVLKTLHRTRLLAPANTLRLARVVVANGFNLMALLRFAAAAYPDRIAIVDATGPLRYDELWHTAEAAAIGLRTELGVHSGQRIAVACRSTTAAVVAIFAAARLGAHVLLVNPEMRTDDIAALAAREHIDVLVYEATLAAAIPTLPACTAALPTDAAAHSVLGLAARYRTAQQMRGSTPAGSVRVFTSGTTGQPKSASRTPSVFNSLPPLLALLSITQLDLHRKLYIAAPLYHGYGLATLFMGIALGAELYLLPRFDAAQACALIAEHQVQATVLLPIMLQRMLAHNPTALASLRCVIAGSAPLQPALARAALLQIGPTLFNLYGSSEAGFAVIATPELLARKPATIGRPLPGVRVRIVNETGQPAAVDVVGRLTVQSAWSTDRAAWIETGDLAYRDADDDLFVTGRADDMVVSGGEKVYPIELERVLAQHPAVAEVAVVGIADVEFGQRLKAVIVLHPDSIADASTLLAWLKPRVARYQMPKIIEVRAVLPYTGLGKLDRRMLREAHVPDAS